MLTPSFEQDELLLRQIRRRGSATVEELAEPVGLTPAAVRQRLTRLMSQGLLRREVVPPSQSNRSARGRPAYRYLLTDRAERFFGSNMADFAATLWHQILALKDTRLREQLVRGTIDGLLERYRPYVQGQSLQERIRQVCSLLAERGVEVELEHRDGAIVLRQLDCPYAAMPHDEACTICSLERTLISELLGCGVLWGQRRKDGLGFCEYVIQIDTGDRGMHGADKRDAGWQEFDYAI